MSSIAVIIPAYTAEQFIGEAIESALNQTRPAKDIIVVDDASTDQTVEIARNFANRVKGQPFSRQGTETPWLDGRAYCSCLASPHKPVCYARHHYSSVHNSRS